MRRFSLLAGLLLVGACGQPAPPLTEGHRSQAMADATAHLIESMDPCVIGVVHNVLIMRELRDCLDLMPQERIRGVWHVGFEDTSFDLNTRWTPLERAFDPRIPQPPMTELIMPRGVGARLWSGMPANARGTLAVGIDFLGRRSRPRAGDSGTTIIVDRVYRMRILGTVRAYVDLPDGRRETMD